MIFIGDSVKVTCTLPIDYKGGECRLYKDDAYKPFKVMIATDWICVFQVTSDELMGRHRRPGRFYLKCDYQLQQYTSVSSDSRGITVHRPVPPPELSVSHRFVSPEDSVEVHCVADSYECSYFRNQAWIARWPCRKNLTGKQLAKWAEPTLLLPVNLTCTYGVSPPSNHMLLFVVDTSQASSSVDCKVSVDDDQMPVFRNDSWTSVDEDGLTVKVQATNSTLRTNETCSHIQTQT
ncbi:uncharacterized protein LOC131977436 [Centropristis striata]|uniref:uncharacterized protein LOC131977436 n=1 Tax=Centropristis striata TaxID=184440 RepID=UPI0027DFBDD1|nr:uncharacterized protein LOC131977436 [Centropristis striata]